MRWSKSFASSSYLQKSLHFAESMQITVRSSLSLQASCPSSLILPAQHWSSCSKNMSHYLKLSACAAVALPPHLWTLVSDHAVAGRGSTEIVLTLHHSHPIAIIYPPLAQIWMTIERYIEHHKTSFRRIGSCVIAPPPRQLLRGIKTRTVKAKNSNVISCLCGSGNWVREYSMTTKYKTIMINHINHRDWAQRLSDSLVSFPFSYY